VRRSRRAGGIDVILVRGRRSTGGSRRLEFGCPLGRLRHARPGTASVAFGRALLSCRGRDEACREIFRKSSVSSAGFNAHRNITICHGGGASFLGCHQPFKFLIIGIRRNVAGRDKRTSRKMDMRIDNCQFELLPGPSVGRKGS